jgi:pimeloyl-ACP methyl ester carboxylesterase
METAEKIAVNRTVILSTRVRAVSPRAGVVAHADLLRRCLDSRGRRKAGALLRIFQRDFPYWIMSRLFKRQFMRLMGVPEAVVASLSPEQYRAIGHFIDWMNPASLRYAGAVFDHTQEVPGSRIAGIRVPTLVIHAQDDTLQPYRNAEFFSSTIPDVRLLSFRKGGHIVALIEADEVGSTIQKHVLANLNERCVLVSTPESAEVRGEL